MKNKVIGILFLFVIFTFIIFSNTAYAASTVDEVISGADSFITAANDASTMDTAELKETSNFLYNLFLGFGIIVAVIVGSIIGIQYMLGSIEERAELKKALVGYVASCTVIFGAFGIWKLAVNMLSNIG